MLLVRLSALGDILFALETLAILKAERPDVRVDFLVEDRFADLLRGHPDIEALIAVPRSKWRGTLGRLRRLRQTRYDVVLDLHGILKSALRVWWTRGRLKLGYARPVAREGAWSVYHRRVKLPRPLPHRAEQGHHLLRELGLAALAPAFEPGRRALLAADAPVPTFFPPDAGLKVILHPGTSAFARFKRWPPERFAALAARLTAAGATVAVSYGPGEAALAAAVCSDTPGILTIPGPELGLLGLAAALRQADVVVAADTGPLHIAWAVGTRVVALFGPKDPGRYGPRGPGHRVLLNDVPCRPCRRRDCVSPQCVLGIEVGAVAAAVWDDGALARRCPP